MVLSGATIRRFELGAISALALICALVAPASARQDASGAATTAKKTSPTPAHKHHSTSSSSPGVKKASSKTSGKRSRRKSRVKGQQKIDSERAQKIQEALIREHYLSGEPTGTWNQACEDAMRKYQADHGWQSKTVPDSRALISLGLGPSKDHLLNPESAMTTLPDAPKSDAIPTSSHSTAAASSPAPPTSSAPTPTSTPQANEPMGPQ